jgi:His/Glu/Gln/Arg/opine family amino acid ABC transporter permease subunit
MSEGDILSILRGAWATVLLSLAGIALGIPVGLALALVRWARVPVASGLVAVYVSLLRATPLVTLVLLLFFALPNVGVPLDPVPAGILALVLNTSAFNAEIWRAALLEFSRDQYDAAQAVGMRRTLRFRLIVLPQIVRASLPALFNEMSALIKVTPALAVIGVVDVTRAAVRVGAETYEPLPPILLATVIYGAIVFCFVAAQRWLERRQAVPAPA